jgi:hypothetical protein
LGSATLWSLLAVLSLFGEARAWNLDPWSMLPSKADSYAIYNMSSIPVAVYHRKTGARYVWAPGFLGYPAINGVKLNYVPSELSVDAGDPSLRATIRLVNQYCEPTLVIEAGPIQTASYSTDSNDEPRRPFVRAPVPRGTAARAEERPKAPQAATPPPASGPDPRERLRSFMERMVHAYIRFRGPELTRRLDELKASHRDLLDGRTNPELSEHLRNYESLCRCVHEFRLKGATTDEIYGRRLCGRISTREARAALLARMQAAR